MPPREPETAVQPDGWRRALSEDGVAIFPAAAPTLRWADAALEIARNLVADPEARAAWLRCEGTWFAGVDLLSNAANGSVSGVPLSGPALDAVAALDLWPACWHRAQVSVTYPGYPRPKEGESAGAARYRLHRDAAHVDGLLPIGADRARMLREPHAFILGIALRAAGPEAAPLVVWPGSHRRMGEVLRQERAAAPDRPATAVDLTEVYRQARRDVFARLPRRTIPLRPGEAVLLHRHLLHGIAPWRGPSDPVGRITAYFRPELADPERWFAP